MDESQSKNIFKITMFGGFTVSCGGRQIITAEDRNGKMLLLLQFLICHRGELITPDELADNVLRGENDSPLVAVKNLVYRLRKLFAGCADPDCIVTERGMYGFIPSIECEIDVELFEGCAGAAFGKRVSDAERFAACLEAMKLYRGGFLPRSSAELWTMQYGAKYEKQFVDYARRAYEISAKLGLYEDMIKPLAAACGLCRYNEELRYMYIDALNETRRVPEAIEQYQDFSRLLFDDLCVEPSHELKELHKKVLGTLQPTAGSIREVRSSFAEQDDYNGALYCTVAVFSRLFQYTVRLAERSGQTSELMLCTIAEGDGAQPASGERLRLLTATLRETIKDTCRVGDAFTRSSPAQFLILLAGTTHENSEVVANRLRAAFYAKKGMGKTRLVCESVSAIDAERIVDKYAKK